MMVSPLKVIKIGLLCSEECYKIIGLHIQSNAASSITHFCFHSSKKFAILDLNQAYCQFKNCIGPHFSMQHCGSSLLPRASDHVPQPIAYRQIGLFPNFSVFLNSYEYNFNILTFTKFEIPHIESGFPTFSTITKFNGENNYLSPNIYYVQLSVGVFTEQFSVVHPCNTIHV